MSGDSKNLNSSEHHNLFSEISPTLVVGLITLGVVSRLFPHPPNFTAVGAIALFGGTYLPKKYTFIILMSAMFISDAIIGFHPMMPYVYGSFIFIALIGYWLRHKPSVLKIVGASLAGSILFFLITNFGVWMQGQMYPLNFQGLVKCYMMGIPFYRGIPTDQAFMFLRNTITGDLFYNAAFFGLYAIAQNYIERRFSWQKTSR